MEKKLKKIILLSAFSILLLSASYGDEGWDYYGSGRDHPLSAYVDRRTYVGYADYAPIEPEYIDGPLVLNSATAPSVISAPAVPSPQPDQYSVNIPNVHGGYNVVVIKQSGEGFVGPQGEYYPEFPKVFQLQMKYGN